MSQSDPVRISAARNTSLYRKLKAEYNDPTFREMVQRVPRDIDLGRNESPFWENNQWFIRDNQLMFYTKFPGLAQAMTQDNQGLTVKLRMMQEDGCGGVPWISGDYIEVADMWALPLDEIERKLLYPCRFLPFKCYYHKGNQLYEGTLVYEVSTMYVSKKQ